MFEKILKKVLTKQKFGCKMLTTKANNNLQDYMEVFIMNIFKSKVKEMNKVKVEYIKIGNLSILGERFELKVGYKNIKTAELNFENNQIKIILPLKYKNKDIGKVINIVLNKMYEKIAQKETEEIMEKIRTKLKFAPEDYKMQIMKNGMAKCTQDKQILINPYIVKFNRETVEYMILHEYCHLKYKTHSKGFWQLIKKAMPQYERYDLVA